MDALLKILLDFQIVGAEEVAQTIRLEETSREPDGIQSNRFNGGKSLSGPDNEIAFGGIKREKREPKKYVFYQKKVWTPLRKQVCELCGFKDIHRSRWVKHNEKCPPEAPKSCQECDKIFRKEAHLKKHVLKEHTKTRCGQGECDYVSFFQGQLRVHMEKEHGDVLSFVCYLCKEGFTKMGQLKKHLNSIHGGIKLSCTRCAAMFLTENSLQSHMVAKHAKYSKLYKFEHGF